MWKELSLLSCLAYVVQVSLPYSSVLMTQALFTAILVFTASLEFVHTREVRRASDCSCLSDPLVDLTVHGEVCQ